MLVHLIKQSALGTRQNKNQEQGLGLEEFVSFVQAQGWGASTVIVIYYERKFQC